MALGFGRHRGKRVDQAPSEYLVWLQQREQDAPHADRLPSEIRSALLLGLAPGTRQALERAQNADPPLAARALWAQRKVLNSDPALACSGLMQTVYVRANHPGAVEAARAYVAANRLCWRCAEPLVASAQEPDWPGRVLHASCGVQVPPSAGGRPQDEAALEA